MSAPTAVPVQHLVLVVEDAAATRLVQQLSPDVGIVVMSGYTQQEVQERLGSEPVGVLQKPFNLLDLQAQLRHVG